MRRAFTLIELLVVIAIIALLVSILLPSMQAVREMAYTVTCQTRQRAFAVAFHSYAGENAGRLPFVNSNNMETGNGPARHQPGWLYHQRAGMSKWEVEVQDGLLWPYIEDTEIYRCPNDLGPWDSGPTHRLTSYLMNRAAVGGSQSHFPAFPIHQFNTDDILMWEVDETRGGGVWNDGTNNPGEGITKRHKTGATVVCFGGHTEWISYDEFYRLARERVRNRLRCAPGRENGW